MPTKSAISGHGSPAWPGPSKIGPDHHMCGTMYLNLWDMLEVNKQVKWTHKLCCRSQIKVKFEMSKEGVLDLYLSVFANFY